MSLFIITLVICSAFMHAGWNILARNQKSSKTAVYKMISCVALIGFVPAAVSELINPSIPDVAWGYVIVAGFFFCNLYVLSGNGL